MASPFLHPLSLEMPYFIPDAESITEFYDAYERCGCKFEVVPVPEMGGDGLRTRLGEGSDVLPILLLPQLEMDSVEAIERWLAHLRDHEFSLFFFFAETGVVSG